MNNLTVILDKNILEQFKAIHSDGELAVRNKIANLEDWLNSLVDSGVEETEIPTVHRFAPGIYLREVHIPKDTLLVGKLHKYEHLNFISKGKVSVLTKDGAAYYEAPCTMISSAGTKRALYTHEDTIWSVIHPNKDDTQDLEKIEDEHIAKDYSSFPILENEVLIAGE